MLRVLASEAGQQVWIDPHFSGSDTLAGDGQMYSWFGAHLLKTVALAIKDQELKS